MRRLSVKLKVTLWYVLAMLVVSLVVFFTMRAVAVQNIERDMNIRLTSRVDELSRIVHMRNGDMDLLKERDFYMAGVHMAVYDSDKNLLRGQISFGISEDFQFKENNVRKVSYNGNRYYEFDRRVTLRDGNTYWIKGLMSYSDESIALQNIVKNNLLFIIILILFAGLGGYFMTSRTLRPVEKMTKTAKSIIESKDLSQRINIGGSRDELANLANTFDEMLGEIEDAFEREQQFTSDASHELRTPIAVILSECEYMTDCAETVDELKNSAQSVKEEAQRMSKLVSELLSISRMDKDTLKLNFEETDLSELVNFVCDEQEEIHGNDIILERDISKDISAEADKFLIARLFINLISNAYQYTEKGGRVTVSLSEDDENAIFSVADTGIGIKKEHIPKIWERFYQVDPARTATESGSMGLGLSMVKWIAEKHGGKIEVKSEFGKGSTFTLTFPKSQNCIL